MKELEKLGKSLMKNQHFDALAVAVIDFKKSSFESFEIPSKVRDTFFDLASLTKPLTLSFARLIYPDLFDEDMDLLLNHRAGLPAIARLCRKTYKQDILRFPIKNSKTLYSDLSAIRLMMEIEKKSNHGLYELVRDYWDKDILHWTELKDLDISQFHPTGFRGGEVILGEVNDDNAYNIKNKLPNAGLFSTVNSLANTLIEINKRKLLIDNMLDSLKSNTQENRFVNGWDCVTDPENTLAGEGCSSLTFGHLGFTGTSIWIDCERMLGHIILTNATKNYWYDRAGLTNLRKALGSSIWANF